MKKTAFTFIAFAILAITFFACSPKPNYGGSEFEMGSEFDLGVGKMGKAKDSDLKVKFNGITEDSRCPDGVNCMWAGKVLANITVSNSEGSQTFDFTQEGKTNKIATKKFKGYKIHLHQVSPYPKDKVKIDKQKYSVRLSVTE